MIEIFDAAAVFLFWLIIGAVFVGIPVVAVLLTVDWRALWFVFTRKQGDR